MKTAKEILETYLRVDGTPLKGNEWIIDCMEEYRSQPTESKELPGDDVKFEELLQAELNKLPYTKHVDDGQYNDGVLVGWELGSRWFYSIASPLLASRDARIRELEEALRSIEIGADPRSEYQAHSWIDTAREIANKALTPPKN